MNQHKKYYWSHVR